MFNESNSMKELHDIRERIYEETKNMSLTEKVKYLNEEADKARKMLTECNKVKE